MADNVDPKGKRSNNELRASLRALIQDVAWEAAEAQEVVEGMVRGK